MIIFTDASYSSQTNTSGFGFVIVDKKFSYRAGNYSFDCKSNNIAEVGSIAEALKYCQVLNLFKYTEDKTLTVITDSTYAVKRILENYVGETDQEEKYLVFIRDALRKCGLKTAVFQVKGHSKGEDKFSYYNEIADRIAADYRYLGEIELEKTKSKSKAKKKGKRR